MMLVSPYGTSAHPPGPLMTHPTPTSAKCASPPSHGEGMGVGGNRHPTHKEP